MQKLITLLSSTHQNNFESFTGYVENVTSLTEGEDIELIKAVISISCLRKYYYVIKWEQVDTIDNLKIQARNAETIVANFEENKRKTYNFRSTRNSFGDQESIRSQKLHNTKM